MKIQFDYQRYLASREWAILRERVRTRSGNICERCRRGPHQETHHLTYARIGQETIEDLQGVCRPCHAFLSAKSDVDPLANVCLFCHPWPVGIKLRHLLVIPRLTRADTTYVELEALIMSYEGWNLHWRPQAWLLATAKNANTVLSEMMSRIDKRDSGGDQLLITEFREGSLTGWVPMEIWHWANTGRCQPDA